ncbi:MAG: hypothetical protein H7301_07830 [Cryobacterium sp.]|nr:hypothetical protein [Oligoflexia bacterium]
MTTLIRKIFFLFVLALSLLSAAWAESPIVLIHGSVGMGHTAAANGIRDDLKARYPGVEVIEIDLREFMNPITKGPSNLAYDFVTQKFPNFYDEIFRDYMSVGREVESIGDMPTMSQFRPKLVLKRLQEIHPQLIVSTFPGATEVLIHLRDEGYFRNIPIGWVHTDLVDETYFARMPMQVDMAFVATPEIRDSWIKRGVPADRVMATGMPLNPKVFNTVSDADLENFKLAKNLDPTAKTILLSGGSNGVGNFPLMVKAIFNAFPNEKVQVVAICGRNVGHIKNLGELAKKLPANQTIFIEPLVKQDELFNYMRVSDAIISKTGGLTPMELFYRKKPLVLLDINGGQEKYNADFFSKVGLARVLTDQSKVGAELHSLLANKENASKLVDRQLQFCGEQCPTRIADWIMSKPHALKALDGKTLDMSPDYQQPGGIFWKCVRALRKFAL